MYVHFSSRQYIPGVTSHYYHPNAVYSTVNKPSSLNVTEKLNIYTL